MTLCLREAGANFFPFPVGRRGGCCWGAKGLRFSVCFFSYMMFDSIYLIYNFKVDASGNMDFYALSSSTANLFLNITV